jgi:hypothetical protein
LYDQDWVKLPKIAYLKNTRIKSGPFIIDLGAHQGVVAKMLVREAAAWGTSLPLKASDITQN